MAATPVTTANSNNFLNSSRTLFRGTGGIPFILSFYDTTIQISKGNGINPTGWTQYNLSSAGTILTAVSGAMDSNDIIHLIWIDVIGNSSDVKYCQFNCNNNTFGTTEILNADIGEAPTPSSVYTAIAIDSNNIPHIVHSQYGKIGGVTTYSAWYGNKYGGSWSSVAISNVKNEHCSSFDIIIGLDDIPVISAQLTPNNTNFIYRGNTNNANAFTSGFGIQNWSCILVSTKGDYFHVGYASPGVQIRKSNFNTWDFSITASNIGTEIAYNNKVSAVIFNEIIYLLYERLTDNKICFQSFDVSGTPTVKDAETVLETGTFNTVRAKWAFWADNDSTGPLVHIAGYGSFVLPTEYSAFHMYGGTGTVEKVGQSIDLTANTLYGFHVLMKKYGTPTDNFFCKIYSGGFEVGLVGTSALLSATILSATDFFYVRFDFPTPLELTAGTYYIVFERTGARDLSNTIQFVNATSIYPGTLSNLNNGVWVDNPTSYDLYINILTKRKPVEIDYAFIDETATPDIWWNKLSLIIPTTWITKTLKWYNGSTWVAKPLKYYNGGSWLTKPIKANM